MQMRAILSIKPQYVERIFDETKKYEFRKQIFKNEQVSEVVIYATAPVMRVVGEFTFKNIIIDSPENIWIKTRDYAGIDFEAYMDYFSNRELGYAIEIERVKKYKKSKSLKSVAPQLVMPPQSFAYID